MKKFILVLCIFLSFSSIVNAESDYGKIEVKKSIKMLEDKRSAEIELKILGNPYNYYETTNIVLVLDGSSSMKSKLNGSETIKIEEVKSAALDIVDKFIGNNVNIGIVLFANDVYEEYSSDKLSNNKDELNQLINSITLNDNKGTNISAGLDKAYSLFDKTVGNNYVILLSDGEPTLFTAYNDEASLILGTGMNDNSVKDICYVDGKFYKSNKYNTKAKCESFDGVWQRVKPSDALINTSQKLKNDDIDIFTINYGSNIKLLKKVASNENYHYESNGYQELSDNIKSIYESISVIAKDMIVVDIVKDIFDVDDSIVSDSIKIDNVNNEKVITWNIGDYSTLNEYCLKYKVTLKNGYYGNTNISNDAYLKAIATIDNPYYINDNNVLLKINNVEGNFVNITNNDNYVNEILYENELLTINKENGLLSNDYKYMLNDNSSVKDEIIIVPGSLKNGTVSINSDGSFSYISQDNYTGMVTFDYYIETTISNGESKEKLKSNISKVTLNVHPKSKVIVEYLDENNNRIVENIVVYGSKDEEYNIEYKEFEEYEFVKVIGETRDKFTTEDKTVSMIYKHKVKTSPVVQTGIESNPIYKYSLVISGISIIMLRKLKKSLK